MTEEGTLAKYLQRALATAMNPAAIADNVVVSAVDSQEVTFKELWREQTCVIVFFRRYLHMAVY